MLQTGSIITRWHTTVLVKVSWPTACVSSRGHQRWLKHRALLFCCKMDSFIWGNPWRCPLGWLIGLNVKHTTIISDSLINRSEYTAHKEICVKAAAAECVFTSEPQELSGHNTSMNIFRCYKLQISKTQRSGKETADANQGVEQTLLLGLDWSDARFTFSPMNKVFNDEKKGFHYKPSADDLSRWWRSSHPSLHTTFVGKDFSWRQPIYTLPHGLDGTTCTPVHIHGVIHQSPMWQPGQVQQRSGASANDMLHMRYWHGDGFYISYVYSHINISVFVSSLQRLFTCDYDTPSHTQTFQLRSPAVNTVAGLSALPEDNPACHRTLESNWWPSSWKTTRSNQWSTVAPISGQIWQKGMKNYGRASRAAENKRPRIHKKSRREADGLQQQRIMSTFTSTSAADTGSRKYED